MKQTKITMNLDGLEDLARQLGRKYRARVGILGSHADRPAVSGSKVKNPLNNAELGMVHMFGSIKRKIPARDFLKMPIEFKKQEIIKAMGTTVVKKALENREIKRIYKILGAAAEAAVLEGFQTGGFGKWPALKPRTVARKGSNKILIDTSELQKSITSDVESA